MRRVKRCYSAHDWIWRVFRGNHRVGYGRRRAGILGHCWRLFGFGLRRCAGRVAECYLCSTLSRPHIRVLIGRVGHRRHVEQVGVNDSPQDRAILLGLEDLPAFWHAEGEGTLRHVAAFYASEHIVAGCRVWPDASCQRICVPRFRAWFGPPIVSKFPHRRALAFHRRSRRAGTLVRRHQAPRSRGPASRILLSLRGGANTGRPPRGMATL